jgi:hypothetical protein
MRKSFILAVGVAGLSLALYSVVRILPAGVPAGQAAIPVRVITLSLQDVPRVLAGVGTLESLHGASGTAPMAAQLSLPENTLPILQRVIQDTEDPPVLAYTPTSPPALLAEGRLTLIDNQATAATVRLKAEFENTRQTLHAGQAVDLEIQTGWLRQVLAVPANAVRGSLDRPTVYRLDGDTVAVVPIKVTYRTAMLEVIEGLQEGDVLVIDGPAALRPGNRVQIVTP